MHSGSSLSPSNPAFSISIGIASLVLEGRPLCDDDYVPEIPVASSSTTYLPATLAAAAAAATTSSHPSTSVPHHHKHVTGATSSAAASAASSTTGFTAAALPQDTVQHIQRLRQKLLLLRSTPSTSSTATAPDHHEPTHLHSHNRHQSVKHTVSLASSSSAQSSTYDSDEELEMIYKKQQQLNEGNVLSSLQSLATTCLKTTPRSFNKTHGLLKTVEAWTTASGTITQQSRQIASKISAQFAENLKKKQIAGAGGSGSCSTAGGGDRSMKQTTCAATSMAMKPHGPHCEQFLKRIGLVKGCGSLAEVAIGGDLLDFEEHFCSASNENVSLCCADGCCRGMPIIIETTYLQCYRWQIHYRQLVSVFSRGDPICIEVYLGPENHVILLEQWIIQQCDR